MLLKKVSLRRHVWSLGDVSWHRTTSRWGQSHNYSKISAALENRTLSQVLTFETDQRNIVIFLRWAKTVEMRICTFTYTTTLPISYHDVYIAVEFTNDKRDHAHWHDNTMNCFRSP